MESTEYREVYFLGRLSSKTSFLASFFMDCDRLHLHTCLLRGCMGLFTRLTLYS